MTRHMDIMTANPQHNDFIEAVLEIRPEKLDKTLTESREVASNKKESFELFVADNTTNTSDTQNVHDSAVNEQLRKTWQQLKQRTPPPSRNRHNIFIDIHSYIQYYVGSDPARVKRAQRALEEIKAGKYNATIDATEDDILTLVWSRSELPENASSKELLKQAVVDALIDMSDDGRNIVCPNGRCARIIESLVHTDFDENIHNGAVTMEQIRNDAFKTSNEILQATIKLLSQSEDPALQNVAKTYEDPSIATDELGEDRFKSIVKEKIETFIDTSYKDKLPLHNYKNLLEHCLTAIDAI
jgi:hypothetical protein